jgi:hypothetical protein
MEVSRVVRAGKIGGDQATRGDVSHAKEPFCCREERILRSEDEWF